MIGDIYIPYDLSEFPKKLPQFAKCRVIGFLYLDKNKYRLKSLNNDSKCEMLVIMDNVASIPAAPVPQPVQIFGQLSYIHKKNADASLDWGRNEDFKTIDTNEWIINLRAKFIQLVQPSLVYYMNDIISEIKSTQFD